MQDVLALLVVSQRCHVAALHTCGFISVSIIKSTLIDMQTLDRRLGASISVANIIARVAIRDIVKLQNETVSTIFRQIILKLKITS